MTESLKIWYGHAFGTCQMGREPLVCRPGAATRVKIHQSVTHTLHRSSGFLKEAYSYQTQGLSRSLVIQTSFLGDVILTTPLLTRLADSNGGGPVDVVATPQGASLLQGHPAVRQLIPYDKRGADKGIAGFRRVVKRIRSTSVDDVAYLAQGSIRSATLALSARYPNRVGFDTADGRWLYTKQVKYQSELHHSQRLLSLADAHRKQRAAPSTDLGEAKPRLYPSSADKEAVETLLREADFDGTSPLVAMAPGSVWATKRWPYYAELARLLPEEWRIVIVGSAQDRGLAGLILAAAPRRTIDATGHLSLLASAELIGRAKVLITNDSAPLHMASAMNTPTVAVFGPTAPRLGFGPLAARNAIAEIVDLDCRPCHAHGPMTCPLGHFHCMQHLDADRVYSITRSITDN